MEGRGTWLAWMASFALLAALAALAGCGDAYEGGLSRRMRGAGETDAPVGTIVPTSEGEKIVTATGLPCEVDAVLRERCQTCHASPPRYGAGTALVTWDELNAPAPGAAGGAKVYELVAARIRDDARPMPPSPNARLDDEALAAIEAWVAAGAKASDAKCLSDKPSTGVKPLSCKPDTVLKANKPYTLSPTGLEDETVCFGVDLDLANKRHITALAPKIDNAAVVHHILLMQSDTPVPAEAFPCSTVGSIAWRLVAGWAPGGDNLELPKEAGVPAERGRTHWVVQMHYNRAALKGAGAVTDNSGYELCTTEDLRPHDAGIVAFGTLAVAIPPRATHTTRCDALLGPEWSGVKFFNASPHMHKFGAAMSTERIPLAGPNAGRPERFFEEKNFSFEAQVNYPADVSVAPGDVIRTRCTWKNPTDLPIVFGETTGSEMCFSFVGYYPKIPLYHWVTPSLATACVPE